ncbi:Rieske 2Fe-2S domain-containing protein [Yinghuangia aomiensis]
MTATQDHPAIADARLHQGVDDGTATGPVDPDAGLVRIPAHRYTSAEFAELELRRLWPRTWQLACCVDHVAEPGDWFEYRVGPFSVLIVRDGDGTLRAFQNACRHAAGTALTQRLGFGVGGVEVRLPRGGRGTWPGSCAECRAGRASVR